MIEKFWRHVEKTIYGISHAKMKNKKFHSYGELEFILFFLAIFTQEFQSINWKSSLNIHYVFIYFTCFFGKIIWQNYISIKNIYSNKHLSLSIEVEFCKVAAESENKIELKYFYQFFYKISILILIYSTKDILSISSIELISFKFLKISAICDDC